MTPAALSAWCLVASSRFTDPAGHPFNEAPAAFCQALAAEAAERPLFPWPDGDRETVALDLAIAARESGYDASRAGDCRSLPAGSPLCSKARGARSCGAFQSPCNITPLGDPARQVRIANRILRQSFVRCPEFPLVPYMSGDRFACGTPYLKRLAAARVAEFRRVLFEVPAREELAGAP